MLGSLTSSSRDQEEEDTTSSDLHDFDNIPPPSVVAAAAPLPPPAASAAFVAVSIRMRQLLVTCAELISQRDFSAAHRLLSVLSDNSSLSGDSTERLVYQFVRALSLRLNVATPSVFLETEEAIQSSYLTANQVTPFIRFCHLTANQAILEAISPENDAIHIIDLEIMHGVQWPPLMQALAERSAADSLYPPPTLRITGTGSDLSVLRRTGDRLLKFAESLGLEFHFQPLLLLNDDPSSLLSHLPSAVTVFPNEALAVNCVLYIHRLLKDDDSGDHLRLFLRKIKSLNPKIVTVAEREASHNHPVFVRRFAEAVEHYAAVFDSLEATLPANSAERMEVERVWFGREIRDIVAGEGEARRERHERLEWWEMMLRSAGFCHVALSGFALTQAKYLLRLHYPAEGYGIHIVDNCFLLGWKNVPLFSVSSWR